MLPKGKPAHFNIFLRIGNHEVHFMENVEIRETTKRPGQEALEEAVGGKARPLAKGSQKGRIWWGEGGSQQPRSHLRGHSAASWSCEFLMSGHNVPWTEWLQVIEQVLSPVRRLKSRVTGPWRRRGRVQFLRSLMVGSGPPRSVCPMGHHSLGVTAAGSHQCQQHSLASS